MCICIHIYIYTRIYIYTYTVFLFVYMHIYVYMYIHMFLWDHPGSSLWSLHALRGAAEQCQDLCSAFTFPEGADHSGWSNGWFLGIPRKLTNRVLRVIFGDLTNVSTSGEHQVVWVGVGQYAFPRFSVWFLLELYGKHVGEYWWSYPERFRSA